MTPTTIKYARDDHSPAAGATDLAASAAHQKVSPSPPRAKLCFARGLDAPLGRDSASLEGWTPPRVRLRLTRGLDAPSGEAPPRSRARHPLERDPASLEALMDSPLPHLLPRPEYLML
jgi:hypothetical protein